MNPDVNRELGEHSAKLEHMEGEVQALRVDMAKVLAILNQQRGGWKTLAAMLTAAAAAGAVLTKLLVWLAQLPGPR